jgi:predicted nucleic acid-binding protein
VLYLDTNLLIVYLTNSPPEHGIPARDFLSGLATGTTVAKITESVLVEATQVLVSRRGLAYPRGETAAALTRILSFRGVRMDDIDLHLRALDRFGSTNLDYVDCVLIESADGPDDAIVSFDRDYDRVQPGVRVEPPTNQQNGSTRESTDTLDEETED